MRIECPCCDYEWDPDEIVDERPLFWVPTKFESDCHDMIADLGAMMDTLMPEIYAQSVADRAFFEGDQWAKVNHKRLHES